MAKITIDQLNEKLVSIQAEMQGLQDGADADGRDLTAEEVEKFDGFKAAFEATEKEIARRRALQAMSEKLDAPGPRAIVPDEVLDSEETPRAQPRKGPKATPGLSAPFEKGTGGFRSFGDFAMRVKDAALRPMGEDTRLKLLKQGEIRAAATTFGQEGVGADGGYAVPPDFKTTILTKVMGEDSLLSRTDQIPTNSNAVTMPVDEDEPWSTTGIQAFWEGEGQAPGQSKLALKTFTVRANKLFALVPVSDELLNDAPALEAYLASKAPDKLLFKVNDAIINGDGVGKPAGLLKGAALVTQGAEGGQTAGTINFNNIVKMWSRMYGPLRRRAIWIINQDVEPQLYGLSIPGTNPSFPAYLPAGGLSNLPYDSLMGRPVVYSEAAQPVGTVGDITLACMDQYCSVVKNGGVRTDVSIHLFFDQDATAFRFILRVGGQPWWSKSIARSKSALPLSAYVALAAR